MRITSLFIFICITTTVFAQKQILGFNVGISTSNIKTDNDYFTDVNNILSFNGQLSYHLQLTSNLTLNSGIEYARLGFIKDLGQIQFGDELANDVSGSNDPSLNKDYEVNYIFNYISVPIAIGYSFGEKLKLNPNVGIVNSFLISGKEVLGDHEYDASENISSFNFSVMLGLRVLCPISNKFSLQLDSTYKNGLSDVYKSDFRDGENIKHRSIALGVGVLYSLN
jgi:hypothetical protein